MRGAVVVSILLLASLLAGCGEPSLTSNAGETVPAGALLQKALNNGQGWDERARLVAIGALEVVPNGNTTAAIEKARAASKQYAALVPGGDQTLGDGKARAWAFDFVSPSKQRLSIVLAPSGEVTYREEGAYSGSTSLPDVGNFTVDSDQAASLAALKEPSFAKLQTIAEQGTIVLTRADTGNRTEWIVALSAVQQGVTQSSIVRVDARSGAVHLQGTAGNTTAKAKPVLPPQEAGQVAGSLAMGATNTQTFKLAKAHGNLSLLLELPNPQPASQVRLTLTTPDGETITMSANAFLPVVPSQPTSTRAQNVPSGEYRVDTTLQSGLSQEFRLSYCTHEVGPSDNPACPANQA